MCCLWWISQRERRSVKFSPCWSSFFDAFRPDIPVVMLWKSVFSNARPFSIGENLAGPVTFAAGMGCVACGSCIPWRSTSVQADEIATRSMVLACIEFCSAQSVGAYPVSCRFMQTMMLGLCPRWRKYTEGKVKNRKHTYCCEFKTECSDMIRQERWNIMFMLKVESYTCLYPTSNKLFLLRLPDYISSWSGHALPEHFDIRHHKDIYGMEYFYIFHQLLWINQKCNI